jgi:hypothetical protein
MSRMSAVQLMTLARSLPSLRISWLKDSPRFYCWKGFQLHDEDYEY